MDAFRQAWTTLLGVLLALGHTAHTEQCDCGEPLEDAAALLLGFEIVPEAKLFEHEVSAEMQIAHDAGIDPDDVRDVAKMVHSIELPAYDIFRVVAEGIEDTRRSYEHAQAALLN
jgi:hypothetical protein